MVLSPRTRYRALDIARDSYDKVRGQIDQSGLAKKALGRDDRNTVPQPASNGRVSNDGNPTYASGT
jgi:hypothetical protein